MNTRHEFMRAEFCWLATDLDGHVAYLTTAGEGPIPTASIADGEWLSDHCDDHLRALSPTDSRPAFPSSYPRDWIVVARVGVFAYDWNRERSRYRLEARPPQPRQLADIADPEIVRVAGRVLLPVRFADARWLDPEIKPLRGDE